MSNGIILLLVFMSNGVQAQKIHKAYDVVVYGATSAGVMAAVAAKQN